MNLKRTTAGQLMTKRIVTINASDNLRQAALKMVDKGTDCLLVAPETAGRAPGMIESETIMERLCEDENNVLDQQHVGEIMTKPAYCVQKDAMLIDVIRMMRRMDVRSAPVLDGVQLVGIISFNDVMKFTALDAPTKVVSRPRESASGPLRILLVEDSRGMRRVLLRTLVSAGFSKEDIIELGDGASALRAAREKIPDIILCDWHMHGLSGLDVLRTMRAEGYNGLFGVLTADQGDAIRIRARAAGADFVVTKPVSAGRFKELLGPLLPASANNPSEQPAKLAS